MSGSPVAELVATAQFKKKCTVSGLLRGQVQATATVEVYIDPSATYPIMGMVEQVGKIDAELDDSTATLTPAKRKALVSERNKLAEQIKDHYASIASSKVTFTVKGVSSGFREDALAQALEAHPAEFDEEVSEFTGEKTRVEQPNLPANKLFTNLLWQGHLVKVEGLDWEQEGFTLEEIAEMRRELPDPAIVAINTVMTKVDLAVDWFKVSADEGFLAKR